MLRELELKLILTYVLTCSPRLMKPAEKPATVGKQISLSADQRGGPRMFVTMGHILVFRRIVISAVRVTNA